MSNTQRKGGRPPGIYSTMHTHFPLCPVFDTEHGVTYFRTDVRNKGGAHDDRQREANKIDHGTFEQGNSRAAAHRVDHGARDN